MQFITLTYNHREYIIPHLESIKWQIEAYSNGETCDLLIYDDCSTDDTVQLIRKWIEINKGLFDHVLIHSYERNIGTVRSYFNSILDLTEDRYKVLAGDDLYGNDNIFDAVGDTRVVLTPAIRFRGHEIVRHTLREIDLLYQESQQRGQFSTHLLRWMLKHRNVIDAPGAIIPRGILLDQDLRDDICQYKYIEDLSLWSYLFCEGRMAPDVVVKPTCLVLYRVGSGISKDKASSLRTEYEIELESILERMGAKRIYRSKIRTKMFTLFVEGRIHLLKLAHRYSDTLITSVKRSEKSALKHIAYIEEQVDRAYVQMGDGR